MCCLSSLNLETWHEWCDAPGFVEDVMRFLDNVLTHFITVAPDGMKRARYAALRERSVGLGVMGFHSFLQAQGLPFEGAMAKSWNMKMFRKIRRDADAASVALAKERGAVPRRRRTRHHGALQPQARRSRRPRRSASSAAAPAPASSRSRRTSTPTRRCRARSRCAIRIWKPSSGARMPTRRRCGSRSSSMKARSRISTCWTNGRRRCSAPRSRSTSAGWSILPPTARRTSARASRSISICRPTSISGTCTCCTGRHGSAA